MCTEKSYGGNNGVREHLGKAVKDKSSSKIKTADKNTKSSLSLKESDIDNEVRDYIKAGEIAKKTREYAKKIIKPDMLLLDIARQIENEIARLGGEVAFPVNLSINDVAAHYHPTLEDTTKANGLLKVDIGVHVNGFIADSAFSLDLTPDKKYEKLILASEEALESALKTLDKNPSLHEIGLAIQSAIQKHGFSPIINLSGHELGKHTIHAGITIPNYGNNNSNRLGEGAYAIEPFATTGEGKIYEGAPSNIYAVIEFRNVRGPSARKILEYVWEKKQTLPFSLREIQEKFGAMARLGLRELEQNGIIHNYPQLIEKSHAPVSQAEHSFIKNSDGKIVVYTK